MEPKQSVDSVFAPSGGRQSIIVKNNRKSSEIMKKLEDSLRKAVNQKLEENQEKKKNFQSQLSRKDLLEQVSNI